MLRPRYTLLSVVLTGDEPPSEFKIFTAGTVETTKGEFVFDEVAAKAVLAEYAAHGIDLMIDYDHASLSSTCAPDPAQAGKAAGWFNIELRNGELWAVNVRWTPPAAEALKRKEWRFYSPAFETKDGHITSLFNVAITNVPATRRLEPLMAASAKGGGMTVEEFIKVCKTLGIDLSGSVEDALAKIKGEKPGNAAEDAADGGADDAQETPVAAADPAAAPAAAPEKEKPAEVAAASARFVRLTGKTSLVDALAEAEVWRASHIALETERQTLAAERATLESAERRKLCVDLVAMGAEFPSTVWTDEKATAIKPRWLSMPIDALRSHAAEQLAARGGKVATSVKPPVSGGPVADGSKAFETSQGRVVLSKRVLAMCVEMKIDPKDYAEQTAKKAADR